MRKFGYIALEDVEVYDPRNSLTETREDAVALIEQVSRQAVIIKFEVLEILRDGEEKAGKLGIIQPMPPAQCVMCGAEIPTDKYRCPECGFLHEED